MRPVRLEMHSRKEIDDVYDDVIYSKGGSILEMLEDWLGPAAFQRSLHRYLTDHEFGNATSSDLILAIKQETGVDVGPVLLGFLDRSGAPVLHVSVVSAGGAARLAVDQSATPWAIPVCVHSEMGRRCEVVTTSHAELDLAEAPTWIWPNAYGSGYYRSVLTANLLDALSKTGYGRLEEPERLALAGDLEGLAKTNQMPAADVMTILPRMSRDPEPQVKVYVAVLAMSLAPVAPDSAREMYAEWLKKTMGLTLSVPAQTKSVESFLRHEH
jgi:aminopeptidase N